MSVQRRPIEETTVHRCGKHSWRSRLTGRATRVVGEGGDVPRGSTIYGTLRIYRGSAVVGIGGSVAGTTPHCRRPPSAPAQQAPHGMVWKCVGLLRAVPTLANAAQACVNSSMSVSCAPGWFCPLVHQRVTRRSASKDGCVDHRFDQEMTTESTLQVWAF